MYIEPMKLSRIDSYCKEHDLSRSQLLVRGALSIVNSQPIPKCDYCPKPSIGRYSVLTHSWDSGEVTLEKNLCSSHLTKARSESEVTEI